jgi:glutamate racemase
MKDSRPTIGVFDSGIGGLTVVKALLNVLPGCRIIYLGDTARTPYGSKSAATIINYSLNNTAFLLHKGADIIVIACNTASSYAFDAIVNQYNRPVFEVTGPGAALAARRSRNRRIGVIGTRATIASGIYTQRLRRLLPDAMVYAAACPLLVPLVEEGWLAKPETRRIVKNYLRPLRDKHIDTLILGCTHYPVLRELIQRKIGRQVKLVDSAEAVASQIGSDRRIECNRRDINPEPLDDRCAVFITDTAEQFRVTARMILNVPVRVEQADL